MCFSAEASIITYILGSIASLYLLITGDKFDKHIGLFSLVFIQMQLAEFFMWIDQNCGYINHYASIFVSYILFLQPYSILLGAILFKTTNIPLNLLYLFFLFFIVFFLKISYEIFTNKRKLCSKSINNGYLSWDLVKKPEFYEYIFYFILMFLIWPFMKNIKGLIAITFGIVVLLFSIINKHTFIFSQWESKWCFFSVALPFIIIFYNKIIKK